MVWLGIILPGWSQDLQPRRWTHLPIDSNFGGIGFIYTSADIAFDPVLRIDDVVLDLQTIPVKYIWSFGLLGKSARVEWLQAYQDAEWNGLVAGVPTRAARSGWSDMSFRFAVNLLGAPPLNREEFAQYQATATSDTIVGAGVEVQLPTGEYFPDRLLNLGTNRVTFRPQLGVVHRQGPWTAEMTASSWFFTDNDDFFSGNYLEQAPLHTIQGYVDYTIQPGHWVGAGVAYAVGGESTVSGLPKDDPRDAVVWGCSWGYSLSKQVNSQLTYFSQRTLTAVGSDSNNLAATLSFNW